MKWPFLPIAILCVALAYAGCGDDDTTPSGAAEAAGGITASGDQEGRTARPTTATEAAERAKPRVPRGATSGDLIVRDLVQGTGDTAGNGDILMVRFVGGIYETGAEIESAGTARKPIGFQLGAGDWLFGFEAGMPGMRVGGRRELIFPTTPSTLPRGSELGDTLVYVVDLLAIAEPGS